MEFRVLGPLEVLDGSQHIDIRRGIPRLLLTAMLLRVGETLSADSLAELVWGDEQPANPANALQTQISYLRKTLASHSPAGRDLIFTRPTGYVLDIAPDHVDAVRFQRSVERATRQAAVGTEAALSSALDELDRALALWRGDAFVDSEGRLFAVAEAARMEQLRVAALEGRVDCLLALGRHRDAVTDLHALVAHHPLHERFHEQLVLGLYRCGRQADALRAYERARTVLLDELGLDPGPALQRTERLVLEQSPDLDWVRAPAGAPPAHAAPATTPTPERDAVRRGGGLPIPLTALIGRDADVARVRDVLSRNRLVTLTGPGGSGKTSLAIGVVGDGDAKATWFVDLGSVTDDAAVALGVTAALGVPTPPTEDPVATLAQALDAEPAVLVLDTCEHVIEGAARLVSRLLSQSRDLHVLATSRRPLGVRGEVVWPVPPLGLPQIDRSPADLADVPSVRLFTERASALDPRFVMDEENARDVAAICIALDGLPLAIELAAARADVLSPSAIRERLHDRFALLVEGGRDAAARQQTLRAAIDWSYDLLTADERRLFVWLSVFAGPFRLEDVGAIAGGAVDDPLRVLVGLVRQSMVAVVADDEYRLLDSPRDYGRSLLLADPKAFEIHERLARRCVQVAAAGSEGIHTGKQQAALVRLRQFLPNIRVSINWCFANEQHELAARTVASLSWFFMLEGMFTEGLSYFRRAQDADGDLSRYARAGVLYGVGLLAAPLGRLDEARTAAAASVELARAGDDVRAVADGLAALSVTEWAQGDLRSAAAHQDEAMMIYESLRDPWRRVDLLVLRARTALDLGDPAAAALLEEAVPLARSLNDHHAVGMALVQLSQYRLAAGDLTGAATAAEEALEAHEALNEPEATAGALHLLGRSRLELGQIDEARALHRRALDLATRIGHVGATCEAVEDLAAVAAAEGDAIRARALLDAALAERTSRGVPLRRAEAARLEALRRSVEAAAPASPAAAESFEGMVAELRGREVAAQRSGASYSSGSPAAAHSSLPPA